jgi:hypothetical protein
VFKKSDIKIINVDFSNVAYSIILIIIRRSVTIAEEFLLRIIGTNSNALNCITSSD